MPKMKLRDGIRIRFARKADLDEIIALCRLHAAHEKAHYYAADKKEKLSVALFENPRKVNCLVVEHELKLIGYATYTIQYSTWEAEDYTYLDCLYLRIEHRGKGLGKKLMERVRIESKLIGISSVQWQTPEFNVPAIRFYHRLGARSLKKERFFWND